MSENSLGTTIIKFEKTLSEKPSSLVFAPLSQAYCEMGLYDKAMSILKKGIRYNPSYVLGYVALAQCYFAQGEDHLAFSTLRPLVAQNRDNIKLQLLFAQVAEKTEDYEESLDTYRYLKFLRPQDKDILEKISWLESKMRQNDINFSKDENVKFEIEDISIESEVEEWEQVSFTEKKTLEEELAPIDQDDWTTLEMSQKNASTENRQDDALFTHTLVDLYIKQGHVDKAKDILEKILELKPNDAETLDKLKSLPVVIEDEVVKSIDKQQVDDSEGHDDLMASFDKLDEDNKDFSSSAESTVVDYSETLNPLHDFHSALLAKGRDKSLKRK